MLRHWIGKQVGTSNVAVRLVPYSAQWPLAFGDVEGRLREAFKPLDVCVDHIGSTSVPGLLSRDVIDVQLGLESLEVDVSAVLRHADFSLRADIWQDHVPSGGSVDPRQWAKRFASGITGNRAVNLHVRQLGAANWRYALLFRDFLRASPAAVSAYAQAKLLLAPLCPSLAVYAEAKDPICDLVMVSAEGWAERTGWAPPHEMVPQFRDSPSWPAPEPPA